MATIFTYSKSLTESLAKSGRPCMTPGAAKTLKNRVVVTILNIRIVQIQSVAQKSVELGWPGSEEGEKNSWTGCKVSVADVADYKDAWPELKK